MTNSNANNFDPQEIAKFEELASRWWDPESEFKPLHEINPLRLDYIDQVAGLAGKRVVDIGCGGGILAESMALRNAEVTGIDMGEAPLAVAKLHLLESGAQVEYLHSTAEDLATNRGGQYDIVTCMEMLEHVPDPESVIHACAQLCKPGGDLFFSTINRNAKSFAMAIVGAEYLLKLVPKGTHTYEKLIRPSELTRWMRSANLIVNNICGLEYNPITKQYSLSDNTDVNYMIHVKKPGK